MYSFSVDWITAVLFLLDFPKTLTEGFSKVQSSLVLFYQSAAGFI